MVATWRIVLNCKERKILVINGILSAEQKKKLHWEDFEAIYIESCFELDMLNHQSIFSIHPLLVSISGLKPFFVTDKLRSRLGILSEVIDGYADSPTSVSVTNKIEKIYRNIDEIGIVHQDIMIQSKESSLIHAFRFVIARKLYKLTPLLSNGASSGYATPFVEVLERVGYIDITLRRIFQAKLIDLGYIRRTRFLNKIHLCPKCQHSHILFVETCPNCKNANIQSQSVIHHFRCANVSPESTYMVNGMLKCPKCNKILRHIGVDYDRPTDIYICNDCNHHFTTPSMKALCTKCKDSFNTAQLLPYDIFEFELTSKGIHAFASNEAYLTLQKDIEVGLSSFDNFIESLNMLSRINRFNDELFILGRLWVLDKNGMIIPIRPDHIILQYLYMSFSGCKVSTDGRLIYMAEIVSTSDENEQSILVYEQFSKLEKDILALKLDYASIQYDVFHIKKSEFNESFIKEFTMLPQK